jgi:hypothetical protein
MTQWYLSFDGNQAGPMDLSTAIAQARQNPNGFAWRDGFAEWQPIASIAELNPVPGAPVPAPPPAVARGTVQTKSTSRSSGPRCSSWKWNWIPAKVPWQKPAP